MALLINVTLENGISVNQSYARIDTVSGYKGGIDITVNYYVTNQSFIDNKSYLKQEMYSFTPSVEEDSPNFIKQGYEYVKTLPEFENAIDA